MLQNAQKAQNAPDECPVEMLQENALDEYFWNTLLTDMSGIRTRSLSATWNRSAIRKAVELRMLQQRAGRQLMEIGVCGLVREARGNRPMDLAKGKCNCQR